MLIDQEQKLNILIFVSHLYDYSNLLIRNCKKYEIIYSTKLKYLMMTSLFVVVVVVVVVGLAIAIIIGAAIVVCSLIVLIGVLRYRRSVT